MTAGAAYGLAQIAGWKHSLHAKPGEAKAFYTAIAEFTLVGALMNFLGFNPMQALVWAGVVQGFSRTQRSLWTSCSRRTKRR